MSSRAEFEDTFSPPDIDITIGNYFRFGGPLVFPLRHTGGVPYSEREPETTDRDTSKLPIFLQRIARQGIILPFPEQVRPQVYTDKILDDSTAFHRECLGQTPEHQAIFEDMSFLNVMEAMRTVNTVRRRILPHDEYRTFKPTPLAQGDPVAVWTYQSQRCDTRYTWVDGNKIENLPNSGSTLIVRVFGTYGDPRLSCQFERHTTDADDTTLLSAQPFMGVHTLSEDKPFKLPTDETTLADFFDLRSGVNIYGLDRRQALAVVAAAALVGSAQRVQEQ